MQRIVILGCSGSGKSTLAVRIGGRCGLPVVHLDLLYWQPGWQIPDTDDFLARVAEVLTGEPWIGEGNYRETFPFRLPRAELVIILDTPG
jgi:adenylate kinase family enzyme